MKKIIIKILISFSPLLFVMNSYGQLLKPVAIDSVVTVSLPADYKKSDVNGEQTFSGKSSFGFIIVSRTVNPASNKVLKKEKDLKKVFAAYVDQLKRSSAGTSILNNHDTIINKLEMHDFTLQTDTGSGPQLRQFRLLYTRDATYTFDYAYAGASAEVAKKEINLFFNSIKVSPDIDGTDQFTMFGQKTGLRGIALIGVIVGGVLVIALLITLIIRNRRRSALSV